MFGSGGVVVGVRGDGMGEPALWFELLEVVVAARVGMDGSPCMIGLRARRPEMRIAVRGRGEDADVCVGWNRAFLAVDDKLLRFIRRALWDDDYWRDKAQLFAQHGASHAIEKARHVTLVVPVLDWAVLEDVVEVGLEFALDVGMEGEVDEGKVDGVGGCFVAGEDEDEGVAEDVGF